MSPAGSTAEAGSLARRTLAAVAPVFVLAVFLAGGGLGVYRYLWNYWVYRGFAPPHDPAYVTQTGTTQTELNALQRVERRALLSLKGHFQLDNLLHFNRKFLPSWERRFVVYERRRDLPRVGIAALAAETYLPFTGKRA